MNNLIEMSGEMTMGTKDIAELLGKNHSDIKRSAERLQSAGALTQPLAELIFEHKGNQYTQYMLNKLDSITLVAQNSPKFTAALVKRWDELERESAKPALPDFSDPVAAARAWADSEEQKRIAQQQLAIAAPKAEVFDKVMERETLLNATQVAQQVGMSAIKMNKKLDELGGVYNRCVKRGRAFCHDWVLGGYGEMKMTPQGYPQPLFTAKGSLRIAELFTSEGVV